MRVLISGGNGQLGSEWTEFCLNNKIEHKSLGSADFNIVNKPQMEEVLDAYAPDIVINCAGYTKVDLAEDETDRAYQINAVGPKILSELCADRKIKLVHYSTDYIFSGTDEDREKYPGGFSENHVPNPINVYGESKLDGENGIIGSGCEHLILRISWVCGKNGNNFVKTMLKLAQTRNELNVVDDQYGSPTFTENIVYNTWQLIKMGEKGIYNISSAGLCTWYEFAKQIFKQTGLDIKVNSVSSNEFKSKAKRPGFSKLDTQKIEKLENIAIIDWKEGLRKLLNQL